MLSMFVLRLRGFKALRVEELRVKFVRDLVA